MFGVDMDKIAERLKAYINTHPFDLGDSERYQAYAESHKSNPPEIKAGFKELDERIGALPLDDNSTVFNLCCSLCTAYENKAFLDGLQYGTNLMMELP